MGKQRTSKIGTEARNVTPSVKQQVLHEAGYKCSNPRCRYPITLDVHHLIYVSEGGADSPENLVPLCPNCHREHHNKIITTDSLRAWKMLLLALNEAFDRRLVDVLLALSNNRTPVVCITGDGWINYAPLAASGLARIDVYVSSSDPFKPTYYRAELTPKGKQFVEAWKKGDQTQAIDLSAPTKPTP